MNKKNKVVSFFVVFMMILTNMVISKTEIQAATGGVGYTIRETFPDPVMAQAVADYIASGNVDHVIVGADITNVNQFNFPNKGITSVEGIQYFTNINTLWLQENQITDIPESVENLTNLMYLYLHSNKISNIPESIGSLTKLKMLDLGDNQITSIPESIGNLTQLENLTLNNNALLSLPENIASLTKLSNLEINGNQLTMLPSDIGNLTNLKILYAYDNELTALPTSIGNLTSLERLNVKNNKLTSLPETMSNLPNLLILDAQNNQITALPENIGEFPLLRFFYLQNNEITSLPESVGAFANLRELNLQGNHLTTFPQSLKTIPDTQLVNVRDQIITLQSIGYDEHLELVNPVEGFGSRAMKFQNISDHGVQDGSNIVWDDLENMEQTLSFDFSQSVSFGIWTTEFSGHVTIEVQPRIDNNAMVVDDMEDVVYNGQEQAINPVVKDASTFALLEKDIDYTIAYQGDVKNAGSVDVTVTGINDYAGLIVEKSFTIAKATPIINDLPQAKEVANGSTLETVMLTGGTVYGVTTFTRSLESVEGVFIWKDPTITVQEADEYEAIFVSHNSNYTNATLRVRVNVKTEPKMTLTSTGGPATGDNHQVPLFETMLVLAGVIVFFGRKRKQLGKA